MTNAFVSPTRTLVVICPDWPLVVLGVNPSEPALVLAAGRVVAATATARIAGVVQGLRRRDAQLACPGVRVVERDEAREARNFEVVASALEAVTPRVEVRRPGWCSFGVRGPARLFGGEEALVRRTVEVVHDALVGLSGSLTVGPIEDGLGSPCHIGVADGSFASTLAARSSDVASGGATVVPPGGTLSFLAPLPVDALLGDGFPEDEPSAPRRELVDVLVRLGLSTIGSFAALPVEDVVGRFGTEGLVAHRLAIGFDDHLSEHRLDPPDLTASVAFDPPIDRVDQAAFAARSLAESFHTGLDRRGVACTRVVVEMETESGERLSRMWRDEGALAPRAVVDRVRWQLEGWLYGSPAARPTSGLVLLTLAPDEVVPATGRQLGFWGGTSSSDVQATRACTRLVGLLGPESVRVPEWRGGRDPDDSVVLVPFIPPVVGSAGVGSRRIRPTESEPPWPGSLPGPFPAAVHADPLPVEVLDAAGRSVVVDGRGALSASPHRLRIKGGMDLGEVLDITAWAGPWPVDERWWDSQRHRRRARLQVVVGDGTAHLVVLSSGRWSIAATYD
ncbi:MAG TPA: DNA repair protein [Acidimicrobiaceae bacterium]|nr:DNA repair protein [Acidimicrobiaceae bacterium]